MVPATYWQAGGLWNPETLLPPEPAVLLPGHFLQRLGEGAPTPLRGTVLGGRRAGNSASVWDPEGGPGGSRGGKPKGGRGAGCRVEAHPARTRKETDRSAALRPIVPPPGPAGRCCVVSARSFRPELAPCLPIVSVQRASLRNPVRHQIPPDKITTRSPGSRPGRTPPSGVRPPPPPHTRRRAPGSTRKMAHPSPEREYGAGRDSRHLRGVSRTRIGGLPPGSVPQGVPPLPQGIR